MSDWNNPGVAWGSSEWEETVSCEMLPESQCWWDVGGRDTPLTAPTRHRRHVADVRQTIFRGGSGHCYHWQEGRQGARWGLWAYVQGQERSQERSRGCWWSQWTVQHGCKLSVQNSHALPGQEGRGRGGTKEELRLTELHEGDDELGQETQWCQGGSERPGAGQIPGNPH